MAQVGINSLMRDMPQLRPQSAQDKSDSQRGHPPPSERLPQSPNAHTVSAQHRVEFSQSETIKRQHSTMQAYQDLSRLNQIISGR